MTLYFRCMASMLGLIVLWIYGFLWMEKEIDPSNDNATVHDLTEPERVPKNLKSNSKRKPKLKGYVPVTNNSAISIVTQLTGEMGTNLHYIACSRGFQIILKKRKGIDTNMKIRHQEKDKWVRGYSNIQRCFPKMKKWDFSFANTDEFSIAHEQQNKWLDSIGIKEPEAKGRKKSKDWVDYYTDIVNNAPPESLTTHINGKIAIPHLIQNRSSVATEFIDKYLAEIRDLFEFDHNKCCRLKPDPDEAVFHFRNFWSELKKEKQGFKEELSPNKTANELFGHLQPGDKIAVTTRYNNSLSQLYVGALKNRGLNVRLISGQSDTEDFCFLMHAKKELVGTHMSKFFLWSALLGSAKKIRAYSVDSPSRRKEFASRFETFDLEMPAYKEEIFENSLLKDRFVNELYESEAMEISKLPRAPKDMVGNPFLGVVQL